MPTPGHNLEVKRQTKNFHIKSFFAFSLYSFKLYYQDPLMSFIYIWHNVRFRFKVCLSCS